MGFYKKQKNLYPHKELNALQTLGYRELFQYYDGTLSLENAVEEIKKNTRRFAKRQGTWFRKNQDIHWFDYTSKSDDIVNFIKVKNAL
jgi:tRNA dimethylallyltransferase